MFINDASTHYLLDVDVCDSQFQNAFATLSTVLNDVDNENISNYSDDTLPKFKSCCCNQLKIDDDVTAMTTDESDLTEQLDRIPSASLEVPPTDQNLEHGPSGFKEARTEAFVANTPKLKRSKRIQNETKNRYKTKHTLLKTQDEKPLRNAPLKDGNSCN